MSTQDSGLTPFNRRMRIEQIADRLIEGPRSLIPPEELDDFGWLGPDLRLSRRNPGFRWTSLAIYTDKTLNRDDHFLEPLIRYVRWEGLKDIQALVPWPTVDIQLSYFEQHRAWVGAQIKAIQTALAQAPFVPYGLSARRDGPDIPGDSRGRFEIYSDNGAQTITFQSDLVFPSDALTELFSQTFAGLVAILQPIARQGWKETYEENLNTTYPSRAWDWDGAPAELPDHMRTDP